MQYLFIFVIHMFSMLVFYKVCCTNEHFVINHSNVMECLFSCVLYQGSQTYYLKKLLELEIIKLNKLLSEISHQLNKLIHSKH